MKNKFITEAELCRKDPWLPEALMYVAYFQNVQVEQMCKSMNISTSHAEKLVKLLEELGFVETENGNKKPTFTLQEYLNAYQCSLEDLESLFGKQHTSLESLSELDGVLPDALMLAVERGVISITPIRRKFEIGYPRAAKIIDIMEEKGFISPAKENGERTVYVKKEDLNNLEKFSRAKTRKREKVFTKDQKTTLEQHKKDFNLDNLKLLDENGKTLNLSESKHLKDLLIEQFCGIGIICMEYQDAEVFFKKNDFVMRCKMFEKPKKEELQAFIDKNKIDAAMILYEVGPEIPIQEIEPLIPKMELVYFSVTNPIPTLEQMKVLIIY